MTQDIYEAALRLESLVTVNYALKRIEPIAFGDGREFVEKVNKLITIADASVGQIELGDSVDQVAAKIGAAVEAMRKGVDRPLSQLSQSEFYALPDGPNDASKVGYPQWHNDNLAVLVWFDEGFFGDGSEWCVCTVGKNQCWKVNGFEHIRDDAYPINRHPIWHKLPSDYVDPDS